MTLAVVNARVWTGAARRPWADAVVVRGERLALVGGSAEARKLAAAAPGARVIDARGALLVPSAADAHVRLVEEVARLAGGPGAAADAAHVDAALRVYAFGGGAPAGAEAGARARAPLGAGEPADFALVDRDLTRVPRETIRQARVLLSVAGGRVVFEAPAA